MRFTIEQMNAAKDAHRHHGTSGGKDNARPMSATEYRARDAGLSCHDLALATVAAQQSRYRPAAMAAGGFAPWSGIAEHLIA